MESSHHHFGMFPPVFPTTPASYPQPVIPAKREDDEVQFVSSNPVKKRKIDCHKTTPQSITSSPRVGPPAPSNHPPPEPAKPIAPPERRGSTGMVDPAPTIQMLDLDPMRGCSMPTPERSDYPASFWTAPCTGPQSSPPISPKTVPEYISPSMLQIDQIRKAASGRSSGGHATVTGWPEPAEPISNPTHVFQPPAAREQGMPCQSQPENQNRAETTKDTIPAHTAPESAGTTESMKITPDINTVLVADAKLGPQQHAAAALISDHSCADTVSKDAALAPSHQRTQRCSNLTVNQVQPHTRQPTPVSSSPTSAAHFGAHGMSNAQVGNCSVPPASGAKGPCRQCMEARMRQQAAHMASTTGLSPATKASTPSQTSVPPPTIQQPWAHLLGLNPYHNALAGAMYGPILQQPLMTGPTGHFVIPPQQSNLPRELSPHRSGGSMFHFGSAPPLAQTQPYATQQPPPKPLKAATASSKSQTARIPDTQPTTKHIIVDIADTCLDMFPFDEVARRHNQPEQKIRDIFSAVIQVPLLRCPTDKRRAGKLGTARVKEFNQAKKEVQTQQGSAGQSRQDSPNQMAYMPSAWEVAQFMGPSDVRLGGFPQLSGPW